MSILLLVVVLLVIAIVLSRLTWASQLGERRSIKHHEQAMDVLRSVAGRPEDGPVDAAQSGADGDGEAAEPAIVFLDDDNGRPGPVTVPPQVADAMRHDRGDRRGNGDGWGDGRRGSDGGWPDAPGTPGGSG